MNIQKSAGIAVRETAQNTLIKKAQPQQPQIAKPSSAPSAVPRSISSLISAAGLPADKLSASIISFARFFSLPLKPELMAAIRRQSLQSSVPDSAAAEKSEAGKLSEAESSPDKSALSLTAARKREALSLAAAAVESKGVELTPKGLETYARAIDPDHERRQNGQEQRKRENKDDNSPDEEKTAKIATVTASGLEEAALEAAENDPLLSILNRLPGKNGRWIVLPFDFTEGDREFRVSMRVLVEQALSPVACMALDIAEAERKWLFVLTPAANCPPTADLASLAVYLHPEPVGDRAQLAIVRELADLLEIPPERVSFNIKTDPFPCEVGFYEASLRGQSSIDEAV